MLPLLYNVPAVVREWNTWSWSHAASHKKILQAIAAQKGRNLTEYQVDPINFLDVGLFLNNNQQAHNDMLAVLGISGSDLTQVDIKDKNQLRAWIDLHADEHRDAEMALNI